MVNQSFAMDEKKTRRFGKLFNTIDFDITESLAAERIRHLKGDVTIGTLRIGHKEFDMTLSELEHLEQTCRLAKQVFHMKYRLGNYGS